MLRDDVMKKMNDIFCNVFDDKNIILSNTTNANDIDGWDSLEQINLIVAIENEFQMIFDINEINKLTNVGEMIDLIMSKL